MPISPSRIDLLVPLKKHFGFDSFRPGQEAVVQDALARHDLLAVMPTGGGKSLCFQLPALLQPGVMLVISPLIALMQDQVRLLADNGIPATFVNSSLPAGEARRRLEATLGGEYKLLYLAPERLMMAEFLEGFLPQLEQRQGLSGFTIDEAHCVSEWGHDFRPEYRQLSQLRTRFPGVPVFGFTATATPRVRADIVAQLALHEPAVHVASFNRPNLFYAVRPKSGRTYREVLAHAQAHSGAGIVYCLSRKRVDEVSAKLNEDGVRALPYHAGLDAETRRDNQERFIRDDVQVMVATVAFGMGINKPDVRWVIHYDLPKTLEGYYQEAGRAGRDGEPAQCILFFGAGDIHTAEYLIAQKMHPETSLPLEEEQRVARRQLRQVVDYAESSSCRRSVQLRYFGEEFPGPCPACDNCLHPRATEDWTLPAQQFVSCVARLAQRGQRYGSGHVINILRGQDSDRIRQLGHHELSTFGIGKERGLDDWRYLARALKQQGLLDETGDGYPVLTLNAASRELLKGERRLEIAAMPLTEKPARRRRRDEKSSTASAAATPGDEALFDRLRALRKRLADEQGVPPYVVFADAALRHMAAEQPVTVTAFAEIPGVGKYKLERYAEIFTAEIRAALA